MNIKDLASNWKAMTLIISGISTIISTAIFIDERYAHNIVVEEHLDVLDKRTNQVLAIMTSQLNTRKTILELAEANGTITPDQRVELTNLRHILK